MELTPKCSYCGGWSKLVTGESVYPHRPDLYHKFFYECKPCKAFVGCHPRTKMPLGRLANSTLRNLKMRAHNAFDPLWQDGTMTRAEAYAWLAKALNINPDDCHIGMFDEALCLKTIQAVE